MPGIYVHLPFCPYICPYCDFAKWPYRGSAAREYLEALNAQIAREPARPAQTIFLGGGTPNTYGAREIATLVETLREKFPADEPREVTIEVNPELVLACDLRTYRECGINRLSIGVQSFDPELIARLGRKHRPEDVGDVVRAARDAGIRSVSLDLMFAIPGQSAVSWHRSLQAALSLEVDHVSAYGLTIEEGTPYATWRRREPQAFMDDGAEAELYEIAIDVLETAGFEHYEISNFAKPGHRCDHNENYWNNGPYMGFGVGAASYGDGERCVATRDLRQYVSAIRDGRPVPADCERLSGRAAAGEAVMLALRTARGVSFDTFRERYGFDFSAVYDPVIRRFVRDGLMESDMARARLTKRGRFLANEVCEAFVTFE